MYVSLRPGISPTYLTTPRAICPRDLVTSTPIPSWTSSHEVGAKGFVKSFDREAPAVGG